jgi:hypothetical protein
MNEVDKLLEGIQQHESPVDDILGTKSTESEPTPKAENEPEEEEQPRKNRRHRRWESQLLDKERELIAREARLQALSEVEKFSKETNSDIPPEWTVLYGDTPEAQKAWKVQEKLLMRAKEEAKAEAVREIESKREEESRKAKQFESYIDSNLEAIEDRYDVDLTSDAPKARKMRREFLELIETVSPKDEDGNIIEYSDFMTTYGLFQKIRTEEKPDNTQKKDIASRSMVRSQSAPAAQPAGRMTFAKAGAEINKLFNR